MPHQRAGVLRGVEFAAEDIGWIGQHRPELMGGRRGGRRTGAADGQETAADAAREGGDEPPLRDVIAMVRGVDSQTVRFSVHHVTAGRAAVATTSGARPAAGAA